VGCLELIGWWTPAGLLYRKRYSAWLALLLCKRSRWLASFGPNVRQLPSRETSMTSRGRTCFPRGVQAVPLFRCGFLRMLACGSLHLMCWCLPPCLFPRDSGRKYLRGASHLVDRGGGCNHFRHAAANRRRLAGAVGRPSPTWPVAKEIGRTGPPTCGLAVESSTPKKSHRRSHHTAPRHAPGPARSRKQLPGQNSGAGTPQAACVHGSTGQHPPERRTRGARADPACGVGRGGPELPPPSSAPPPARHRPLEPPAPLRPDQWPWKHRCIRVGGPTLRCRATRAVATGCPHQQRRRPAAPRAVRCRQRVAAGPGGHRLAVGRCAPAGASVRV